MARFQVSRRTRRLGVAFAALAAAIAPLTVVMPTTQASTCTMRHSTDSFAGRARESHFWVNVPERGTPVVTEEYVDRGPVGTGPMNLDIYTCLRDGQWELEAVYIDDNYADLVVSTTYRNGRKIVRAVPQEGRTGYGVFVREIRPRGLMVAPRKCAEEPRTVTWLDVANGVLGLPVPVPQKYAVAQYVTQVLLPDSPDDNKYYCGAIDDLARVPLQIGPKGGAWVDIPEGERLYIAERRSSYEDSDRCNYRAYVSCKRVDKTVMWVINR